MGAIQAVRAARLRVPEDAAEEVAELADRALQRIVDVLEERVDSFHAPSVLKAATLLREEVCGKQTQKLELGGNVVVEIRKESKE